MLKHVFLFDATRHIGLVQSLIGSAQTYTSQFQPEAVEWYAKPQQASGFREAGVQVHVVSGPAAWPAIESRVKELATNGGVDSVFHVLSYDPLVIQSAAGLNGPDLAVSALSLATFSRKTGTERRPVLVPSNAACPLTLVEAVSATKRMLERRGAVSPNTAIKQSFLRKLLGAEDSRFFLDFADPGSRTLITDIVSEGLRSGWLQRFRLENKTGTERLYLAAQAATAAIPPTPAASPELTTAAHPTMPSSLPEVAPAGAAGLKDKGRQRTDQMIHCLKQRRIYSPKTIRDYVFVALREATKQSLLMPLSASQLNRQVCSNAETQAKAAGVAYDYWYAASDALLEMMLGAGVLLDEKSQPIRPGLQARGTKVHNVAPDFEDRCEMFLIQHLVKGLGDVSQHDRTALAHALFKVDPKQKSIFDMQDRVDELLVKLQDRVCERDDGIFVLDTGQLAKAM
jgi:hypothetical protein